MTPLNVDPTHLHIVLFKARLRVPKVTAHLNKTLPTLPDRYLPGSNESIKGPEWEPGLRFPQPLVGPTVM